jgi:hypothetical protein
LKKQIGEGKVVFDNGEILHVSCNEWIYAILRRHEKPNRFCIVTVLIQDKKYRNEMLKTRIEKKKPLLRS